MADCDQRIKFISGFSGSNGIVVITQNEALMWTDSRYYLQAANQLEKGWELRKMESGVDSYFEWITKTLAKGSRIGFDPTQISQCKHLKMMMNSCIQKQVKILL